MVWVEDEVLVAAVVGEGDNLAAPGVQEGEVWAVGEALETKPLTLSQQTSVAWSSAKVNGH